MNKKTIVLLLLYTMSLAVFSQVRCVPTFVSCSLYFPYNGENTISVSYRPYGATEWMSAYMPYVDEELGECRLSLVRLSSDTKYEVRVQMDEKEQTTVFTTWSDHPVVEKTIRLSSLTHEKDGSVIIKGLHGRVDGWIRIVGDKKIQAGKLHDAALSMKDCQYVLLENIEVSGGRLHAIKTNETVSDVRFINCNIYHWGRECVDQDSTGHYLDVDGKMINNDAGLCIYKSHNVVLERSYIHDPNGKTNPWNSVIEMGQYKGKNYVFSHPQGPNAVYVMESAGGVVLRYNDLCGSQTHRYNDPVEAWRNRDVLGGFAYDADVYGNVMAFGQDDAIEMDGGQCNIRVFDNRIEQTYCGISTAPNRKGPSYIFNNVLWNMANSVGKTGNAIKNGGGEEFTRGTQYLFHNTIIHDGGGMIGVGYGKGEDREMFHAVTRNNIIYSLCSDRGTARKGYCINDLYNVDACDFDYDVIANRCNAGGKGTIYAKEGSEAHGIYKEPLFSNMVVGLLTLRDDDRGIGKGEYLPNFNTEEKKSIGAFQVGESSLFPQRPLAIESDKYKVTLIGQAAQNVVLTIGDVEDESYELCMAEDMHKWLKIKTSSKKLLRNGQLVLTLSAKDNVEYARKGMLFVRMKNGLSVPITISAE